MSLSKAGLLKMFNAYSFLDAKNAMQYARIFSRVIELSQPKNILEIGFFTGNSALSWLELSVANLTSVDPMQGVSGMAFDGKIEHVDVLKSFYGPRFSFIQKDSRLVRPDLAGQSFDLIFIDGDHSAEGAANDLQLSIDLSIPWVFVDDFSSQVTDAFSGFSDRFDLVEEFNRNSSGTFIPMRLFKRK